MKRATRVADPRFPRTRHRHADVRTTLLQIDSESARRELDLYGLLSLSPRSKLRLIVRANLEIKL